MLPRGTYPEVLGSVFQFSRPVGRPVKIAEERVEAEGQEPHVPHENPWKIAVDEEQLQSVDHDYDKLNHLHRRQVLLPPQVLLYPWPKSAQQIIRVHYDVHESVEKPGESTVTV